MKVKQTADNKELAKIYLDSYKLILKNDINIICLYDDFNKTIREELIHIEEKEPLKIFKKAHKEWENSKNALNNLYEKITLGLRQEYKDFEEIMDLIPHHKSRI